MFIINKLTFYKWVATSVGYRMLMFYILYDLTGSISIADHWLQEWNLWSEHGNYKYKKFRYNYIDAKSKNFKRINNKTG